MSYDLEDVPHLSESDARRLTEEVKTDLDQLRERVASLYYGEADKALGYANWAEYVKAEFGDLPLKLPTEKRQEVVRGMADHGHSTRAIAAAVGTSHTTVENDLRRQEVANEDHEEAEVVDAELVEDEESEPPPRTGRAKRTDVVGSMSSIDVRVREAAKLAEAIKPSHFRDKSDIAEHWLRVIKPSVDQLSELMNLLQKASNP